MASVMDANACFSRLALTGYLLARHWTFVQLELIEKLGSGSDVKLTVFGVDHAEPLGLTNAELRFGDQLNDQFRVCF